MNFQWKESWKGLNSGQEPDLNNGPEEKEDHTPSRGMMAIVKKLFGFVYLAGFVVCEAVIGIHIGKDLKSSYALDDADVGIAARINGPKDALYFREPSKKDVLQLDGYDDGWKRLYTWPGIALSTVFNPSKQAYKEESRSVDGIPVYTPVPKGAIEAGLVDKTSLVSFDEAQKSRTAAVKAALESDQLQDEMEIYPEARWSLKIKNNSSR